MRDKALHLIDGSGQLHRAYFAIRGLTTRSGQPTNAVYGFTAMIRRMLQERSPEWIGVAFDVAGPTFRHSEYGEYKANRPKMEEDLTTQIPYIRRVCDALRIPVLESPGFEADDVIATLAHQAVEAGLRVIIVSSDKDLLQLVDDDRGIHVLSPGREGAAPILFDAQRVEQKHGVSPRHMVDLLALMGDASDNVPGVKGIGEKGARELVREFGSLEEILENTARVKKPAHRDGLLNNRDQALLSKRLVTLRRDAPVTLDLEALRRKEPDRGAARALFRELEFASFAREFEPEPIRLQCEPVEITNERSLNELGDRLRSSERFALTLILSSESAMREMLAGVALAYETGRPRVIPLGRIDALPTELVLDALRPLLADPRYPKLFLDGKRDRRVLMRHGVRIEGAFFDLSIAAYLLDPGRRDDRLHELAFELLGERPADLRQASPLSRAAERADLTLRLTEAVERRMEQEGLHVLYRDIELPLAGLLAEMESIGVKVDAPHLVRMSREMEHQLDELTQRIHSLAGERFNVNSPVQLREILFEKLGLRAGRRTAKTRAASTSEDVLEELARTHELPRLILEYRGLQKLQSTYVDALPGLIHPQTGRIHASLNQTVTATGRLSSSDPNLQNIPIRSEMGRRIREAFVPEDGYVLLSADYSQIELRVLAHMSEDESLLDAFRQGEDVHERTAHELFGPLSFLPREEQRRRAKMVNYALLYGKTAFTLAKDLGVSRREAEEFIADYFRRYPGVKRFVERTLEQARVSGVVRTLLGRIRRLPELRARNAQIRQEAERQAINMPIQGSAADLIKKAMLDLHRELNRRGSGARLILQIHDELLLEVPDDEGPGLVSLVREIMEGALSFKVPLVVTVHLGRNWAEAH